jgi:hypothetical protein
LASQNYGNAYDRAFNEYMQKYSIFKGNEDRPFDKLNALTSTGLKAAGT